jgi:hypothetical protein
MGDTQPCLSAVRAVDLGIGERPQGPAPTRIAALPASPARLSHQSSTSRTRPAMKKPHLLRKPEQDVLCRGTRITSATASRAESAIWCTASPLLMVTRRET